MEFSEFNDSRTVKAPLSRLTFEISPQNVQIFSQFDCVGEFMVKPANLLLNFGYSVGLLQRHGTRCRFCYFTRFFILCGDVMSLGLSRKVPGIWPSTSNFWDFVTKCLIFMMNS